MTLVGQRPAPGPPRPWRFPPFTRHEVAGGRVISCHLPGRPLAVASLVVDAGAVTEPAGQEGVALVAARALSEGTRQRDAYAFAVDSERLGAGWSVDTDWDSLRCGFEVPVDHLADAVALLAEAVRSPAYDDETLLRVRDERVDEMHLELSQPGVRAMKAFAGEVFAPSSRYSTPDGGAVERVEGLTPADVRRFHADRFGADSATLLLVGDLIGVEVESVAAVVFDGWAGAAKVPEAPSAAVRDAGRRVVVVDRPGVQSMIYAGHDGPPRRVDDYVAMTTMGLVLGGMFTSRLNYRLREDKGYSYGAFGGFDTRRHGGLFVTRSAVATDVTVPALVAAVGEIVELHENGVTEEELDRARSYRAGVFPINFAGPGAVASGLGDLVVHDFADDHFDRLREQILAVDKQAVDAAAAGRIRPDELVCVVVGPADAVADQLHDAGLGPVTVVPD
jgi:predicted Zn-dependent peptidase